LNEIIIKLKEIGFDTNMTKEQEEEYKNLSMVSGGRFKSLRFGDVNYIVTQSAFFFDRFMTATHICKTLNVMDKKQRVLIFDGVFGESFLKKIQGITDDLLKKIHDDLYSKKFEEGIECSPFEQHVAVKNIFRNAARSSNGLNPQN
jgi:hypothetical protein